jgi:hypothetical protein
MFTLRCTKKLLTRLKVKPEAAPPPSTGRLGEWYADTLNLGRERLILCVSERTLLPVIIKAAGGVADLPARLVRGLRETLESLGAPEAAIEAEVSAMREVTLAKTASRVVLGTMNDFQLMAGHAERRSSKESLLELGLWLAQSPCSPIGGASPCDATLVALGNGNLVVSATLSATPELAELLARVRRDVALPVDAHVIGEPVTVTGIHLRGARAGLRATCERSGRRDEVCLSEVAFPAGSGAARVVASYRAWLGLAEASAGTEPAEDRAHKVAPADVTPGEPVELVVLARKTNALRCRLVGSTREVTVRTAVRDEVQGAIVTVTPTRQWSYARHPYLSGRVSALRVDAGALGLVPLALRDEGEWDPEDEYWGEAGDALEDWANEIVARGPRPAFEMEQILPGEVGDDWDSIVEAAELRAGGRVGEAIELLEGLLAKDLRCLDAHAHLGNFAFDHFPREASRHYEVGAAIGGLTVPEDFRGLLPWGLIDNRPYLRCLHGLGLCHWRLGRPAQAAAIFTRMLWLNPSDNQGVRFELAAVQAGKAWRELA